MAVSVQWTVVSWYHNYPFVPSMNPTFVPSGEPICAPSGESSVFPMGEPSYKSSGVPSGEPSVVPSMNPTFVPSGEPICAPSGERQRGGSMVAGVLHLSERSVLWERFLHRLVNDEHREGMQTPIFLWWRVTGPRT
jgi:hypothetical protein